MRDGVTGGGWADHGGGDGAQPRPLVARAEPSEALRKLLAHGRSVSAVDYLGALAKAQRYAAGLTDIFDAYDAIVTPAAPGVAPKGLGSTGDPAFCSRPCLC